MQQKHQLFFLNSVVFVTFFSAVRFFLNLAFTRFLIPEDFGLIIIPLLIFSFFDIFVEGGLQSAIIKHNTTTQNIFEIQKRRLRFWLSWSPLVLICLFLIEIFILEYSIPVLIIVAYAFGSFFKIFQYFVESKLISDGRYILTESIGFIVTAGIYIALIIGINMNSSVPGYYFLCILALMYPLIYSAVLHFVLSRHQSDFEIANNEKLHTFSNSILRSSVIEYFGSKLDEISIALVLNPNVLGLYSKIKELVIMLGTFSSKIICRPWFYLSSRFESKSVFLIWALSLLISIILVIFSVPLILFLLGLIVNFLGDNWSAMNEYLFVIGIMVYLYFVVTFTRYTLLGLDLPEKQLMVDRIAFLMRALFYASFVFILYDPNTFELINIFYIEITLYSLVFIMQVFLMFHVLKSIYSSNESLSDQ